MADQAQSSSLDKKSKRDKSLYINVSDLRKRLGSSSEINVDVVLEKVKVIDTFAEGPVTGKLTLESIERGINVFGDVTMTWAADCRRCLEKMEQKQTIEISEAFQMGAPKDSELIDFDGVHVDLLPLVVEAVAFSLPLAPLCSSDCRGPAPSVYPTLTEDELVSKPAADPRWAGLDEIRFD